MSLTIVICKQGNIVLIENRTAMELRSLNMLKVFNFRCYCELAANVNSTSSIQCNEIYIYRHTGWTNSAAKLYYAIVIEIAEKYDNVISAFSSAEKCLTQNIGLSRTPTM